MRCVSLCGVRSFIVRCVSVPSGFLTATVRLKVYSRFCEATRASVANARAYSTGVHPLGHRCAGTVARSSVDGGAFPFCKLSARVHSLVFLKLNALRLSPGNDRSNDATGQIWSMTKSSSFIEAVSGPKKPMYSLNEHPRSSTVFLSLFTALNLKAAFTLSLHLVAMSCWEPVPRCALLRLAVR